MQSNSSFIVHGAHITENLEHHKKSDVRRILEDKGFQEDGSGDDDAVHFTKSDSGEQDKQTVIRFGDGDFVETVEHLG